MADTPKLISTLNHKGRLVHLPAPTLVGIPGRHGVRERVRIALMTSGEAFLHHGLLGVIL